MSQSALLQELTRLLAVALSEDSSRDYIEVEALLKGENGKACRQFIEAIATRIDPQHAQLPPSQALHLLGSIRARHAVGIQVDVLPGLDIAAVAKAHHNDREFLLTYTAALEKANRDARAEFGRNRDTFVNQLTRIQSLSDRLNALLAALGLPADSSQQDALAAVSSLQRRLDLYIGLHTGYENQLGILKDTSGGVWDPVPEETIGSAITDLQQQVRELKDCVALAGKQQAEQNKEIVGLRASKERLEQCIERAEALAKHRGPVPPPCDFRSRLETEVHTLLMLHKSCEGIVSSIYAMLGLEGDPIGSSVVAAIQDIQRQQAELRVRSLDEKICVAALAAQAPGNELRILAKTLQSVINPTDRLERHTDVETGDVVFRYVRVQPPEQPPGSIGSQWAAPEPPLQRELSDAEFINAIGELPKLS